MYLNSHYLGLGRVGLSWATTIAAFIKLAFAEFKSRVAAEDEEKGGKVLDIFLCS